MHKVTVIAEAGINHQGDMDKAKEMIVLAKSSGADIWKTQWYEAEQVLGPYNPYLAEAGEAQFTEEQHAELKQFCDRAGIEWCVSIFDSKHIAPVEAIGIKRYKIASRAALNDDLIANIRRTGRPIILSTGLCNQAQIKHIIGLLGPTYPLTLLYCICDYPTRLERLNFDKMVAMREYSPVGFSSHCPRIAPTVNAVVRGATVVENHVVLDKLQKGCDVSSSLSFGEFSSMVAIIRDMEAICSA